MSLRFNSSHPVISLLSPTVAGLIVYPVIALFTLVLQTIPMLQSYLQVSQQWEVSRLLLTEISKFLLLILGTNWTNTLVLGLFWAVVGLVVYFALHGIISFISEVTLDMHDEKNVQPVGGRPQEEVRRFIERSALRLFMIAVAVFYAIMVLWPFFKGDVLTHSSSLQPYLSEHPAINALVLFVGHCIALHIFTVMLRLALLKRRLFD